MNRTTTALILLTALTLTRPAMTAELEATAFHLDAPKRITVQPCEAPTFAKKESDDHRDTPILELPGPAPLDKKPPVKPGASTVLTGGSRIRLHKNEPLTLAGASTSVVGEPTAATRGQNVLFTGNWFAATSLDGGKTFTCVDVGQTFGRSPNDQEVCCDQFAIYDATHDLMVWLVQYRDDTASGTKAANIHRLAVAAGEDIANGQWRYYDLTPSRVGGAETEWFDYPALVVGSRHLYVTTNAYDTVDESVFRSLVVRLPLAELTRYEPVAGHYLSPEAAGTLRVADGSTNIGFWATHARKGPADFLRIYSWPDTGVKVTTTDIRVSDWKGKAFAAMQNGYDWLRRSDGRPTAGWLSGGVLGFAWTAGQDATFKYPHVRVALVQTTPVMKLVSEPHIWNGEFAFAYPSIAVNRADEVGVSLSYGGNKTYPSHAVGALMKNAAGTLSWELFRAAEGTDAPADEIWGDYQHVAPHGADPKIWVASGHILSGGNDDNHVQPRYVEFSLAPAPPPLDEQTLETALDDASRLVAAFEQQPDNDAAIRRLTERLDETLTAIETSARPASNLTPQQLAILGTHKRTPTDKDGFDVKDTIERAQLIEVIKAAREKLDQLDDTNSQQGKEMAETIQRSLEKTLAEPKPPK